MPARSEASGAPLAPTLAFLGAWLVAWTIDLRWPFPVGTADVSPLRAVAGLTALAAGVALFFWGLITFASERTGIMMQEPARHLVVVGPYRWSRNPMYVGFAAGYAGLALLANSLWPFLLLPPVLVAVVVGVIEPEERYLRRTFGSAYEAYCRRVRRWL